ncbi:MAG: DUF7507 domain-containing protein [Christensenellales bacterium]
MIRKVRRITALVLAVVMLLSVAPLSVLADEHSQYSPSWSAKGNYVHTRRYEFYVGESLVDTQIVKNGDSLLAPATPNAPGGTKFTGWFVGNEQVVFNTVFNDVTSTKTVIANAVFADVCYVYFVYDSTDDGENNGDIIATKEVKPGDKTDANNVPLVVNTPGKVFAHWSDSIDGAAFDFGNETIDEDTNLYAVLNDRWTVTFYEQGGSYTIPKYILNGQPLGDVTPPIRPGYSFREWNTKADGSGTKYTTATLINSSVNLYAIWDAQRVNYTIVYWQENADDSEFTYYETVTVTGGNERPFAGGTITVPSSRIRNDRYTYFSYKEHDTGVIANGDGTSVVNVYYSRNSYTVQFNLNRKNATMTIGGNTYNNGGTLYSFTAKYNADISALWPTASNIPNVGSDYFIGWPSGSGTTYVSKRMNFTSDLFSTSGTRTYKGSWDSDVRTYDLHYMIESLDGTGTLYNGVYYKEDMAYNQLANAWGNWSAKQIAGVTNVGKQQDDSPGGDGDYDVYFYYTRNSYDLSFYNYNATVPGHTETLKYGTDISDRSFIPAKPTVLPEGYEFGGWYTTLDTLDGSQFNWTDAEMPIGNLELYAKWSPPVHTVKFFTDEAHSEYDFVVNIAHNGSIKESDLHHDPGDNWQGWYWYVGGVFVPFSFDTKITDDSIVIYPVWETNSYGVKYDVNDGGGTAPVDSNRYKAGSRASVKAPTDQMTAPPNAEVFIGWNTAADGSGVFYYPNSNLTITGNMLLYAQWGPKVAKTSLTYHSKYPEGVTISNSSKVHTVDDGVGGQRSELWNNERITVWDNGFQVPDDYYFAGWDTSSTGSGSIIAPDSELVVYNGGTNNLYACWKPKVRITITAASQSWTYDGQEHTNPSVTVTEGTLLSGDTLVATATGSVTNVSDTAEGNNPIADGYKVMRGETDVTCRYKITPVRGTLTVNPKAVTISTGSAEKEYDGTALTKDEAGITGLVNGETATVTATGSQTEVGDSTNTYSIDWGTTDSNNYAITEDLGTLKVTTNATAEVKLIAADAEKVYDGSALTKTDGVTWTGLPAGFTVEASSTGSQTDAGESANVVNDGYVIKDAGDNDKTANFTSVTKVNGTLKVTKAPVTITTGSAEKEYDGTALTKDEAGITGLVNGETATVTATGSQTEVGDSTNTYSIDWGTTDSNNYAITEDLGTLKVTTNATAEVKLIAADAEKVYDGSALTKTDGVTWTGLPAGFTVEASSTGSQTDAGESANVVNDGYVIKDAGDNDKTANFTSVTKVNGTLKVTKAPVTITTGSAEKEYDGTALTKDEAGITGLVNGETATVTATGSQTEVGDSTNTYSIDWGTTDSNNYAITEDLGTLKVTTNATAEVKLIAADAEKVYDGSALTKTDGVTWTGLPAGFTVEASSTGSQTDAGESANVVNDGYVIKDAGDNDKTANFTSVTKVNGTLKVTKAPVTITTGSAEKEYDGTALTKDEAGITGLVNGETATVTATGSQTEVGDSTNTYSIDWGTTDSNNYAITEDLGTLKVTTNATAEVKLIAADAEKVYDGSALTKTDGVTWTGLPAGFTVEASSTGSQTDAGESANVVNDGYVIKDAGDNDKTANFTSVTKVNGTLKVTKAPVTITTGSAEKPYDGDPLTKDEVSITGLVAGESVTLVATGSQTEVGSSDNTYSITWDNAKAVNYTITNNLGTLTITQDPSIALVKEVDKTAVNAAGDVIYTYTITNTGDVPLTELSVTDDKISGKIVSTLTKLDPGASTEVTATYTITQAMMDAGDPIINIATASGLASDRTTVVTSDKATAAVEISQEPSAKVEKTATEDSFENVDDELHYTVVITNTGNITLKSIEITDTLVPFDEMTLVGDTNGDGHLQVDETWTLTYIYTVKQDDLDAGKVLNKVSVTKPENPDNPDEPDLPPTEGEEEVPAEQKPSAKVEKTATEASYENVGDELHYTVVITNTGNITLKNIEITDTLVPFDEMTLVGDTNGDGHLQVDETWTLTYTYTVKQDDLDAGKVLNKVSVTKPNNPDNPDEPDMPPTEGEEEVPADQKPSAKVEKTATETSFEAVGDELHYTVVITNTGNITLKNIEINDTLVPFDEMTLTGDANNDGHLDVDETWTLTYTYTVTQDDLDAGKVLNKVSVTKPENPDNPDEPDLPPAEEEHVVPGPAFLDIEAIINPTKSLAGRVLTAGEFTFELRQGDTLLQSTTNDAEGNILFSSLGYTQEDIGQTYSYTIVEVPAMEANMTYSEMAIDFTVLVEDAGDGVLSLTVNAPTDVIFFNVYTAPAPEPIPAPPVLNFDLGVVPSNVADCLE